MNTYTFHITLYDLAFLGVIFIGLTFALQLWFSKRVNRAANRLLALTLVTIVLWIARILGIDIGLLAYIPHWSRLPLQYSLAFGPLIYFYVLKLTRPEYKFSRKDLLHFIPVVPEQALLHSPVLPLMTVVSVTTYLYCSHRLIERFYRRQKFNRGDRYRYELRWLQKSLTVLGFVWLLWIPYAAVNYFYYHHQEGIQVHYPFYLCVAAMLIGIAVSAYLRMDVSVPADKLPILKPLLPVELKQKGAWLKDAMKTKGYYKDPELSLSSLAENLGLTTHELSRIINTALKKNFNDLINEYRVADVVQKMLDPAYDHFTLMGIAYNSGFNSKSAFHRIFKDRIGKSPAEYMAELKKELPSYNLGQHPRSAVVISYQETTRSGLLRN